MKLLIFGNVLKQDEVVSKQLSLLLSPAAERPAVDIRNEVPGPRTVLTHSSAACVLQQDHVSGEHWPIT